MPKRLTNAALAAQLGISKQAFHRDVANGCPTYALDAARAWRAQNVRPRVTPPASPHVDTPGHVPTPAEALLRARAAEATARARRAEAEMARADGRAIDAGQLLASLRAWRAGFGVAAQSFGAQIERQVRSAIGDELAGRIGLRRICVTAEQALENQMLGVLLEQLRIHAPTLARGIDDHIEEKKR